jgi:peptidoglycan/LPS O-acetylase OafA/YrhL
MYGNRLYALDALRGMAAVIVVIGHLQHITHAPWLVTNYALSVDFFFMLSGYVMARTYEARLADGLKPLRFLWLRFRRLWRTMAIGTLIGFAVHLGRNGATPGAVGALAAGLLFLPWPLRAGWLYPFNGPSWSIFDELLANFVHGAVLARMNERQLLAVLAASTAAFAGYIFSSGEWPTGGWPDMFLPAIARTMVSYTIGILLFRRFRDVSRIRVPLVVLLAIPPLFVLATAVMPVWSHMLFIAPVSTALIVAGSACRLSDNAARWAAAAGALSFPLYAVHYPLLEILTAFVSARVALVVVLLTIALATWLLARRRRLEFSTAPAPILAAE